VLIVFELTQNFDLATAALASVAFANLVGFRIYGRSYFDAQLQARDFDLSLGRDKVTAQQQSIRHLVSRDYTTVDSGRTLTEVRAALVNVGTLTSQRLMELASGETPLDELARDHATPEALTLNADESLWAAMSKLKDFEGESIPVVEGERLVGVLLESTIVTAYLGVIDRIRKEEHAAI
jgi:CIC family chloride channel protein